MQRTSYRRAAGAIAGASLLATTLGLGSGVFAFSGNANYYDISKLTPLAQRAAVNLYRQGIMNGTAPGKFSPYIQVTRAQAVKFIVNALRLPKATPSTPATYGDVSNFSQYFPYIEAAVKAGILTGMAPASGDFNPSTPITRADFAVLATNALGDQGLARSLANNTSKYSYLRDLGQVPAGDLGDVNAMMQVGIIPPYDSSRYAPLNKVNREEFAVAIMRLYNVLSAQGQLSASLTPAAAGTGVGQADSLSLTVRNAQGQTLSAAQLSQYTVAYAVTGPNGASATVSPNGTFVATSAGTYTVEVSISGTGLSSPVTAQTVITVYGAAAALKVLPSSPSVPADKAATDTVQVQVVDSAGHPVADFNGNVTLSDSNNGTELVGANGQPQPGAVTEAATNGVATFTIQSVNATVGASDTLTATAAATSLPAATAQVSTVAQQATSVAVTDSSNYLQANQGGNQDTISAVVEDQAGEAMLSGSYSLTFSMTGPATFLSGTTAPQTEAFIADGSASPNPATATIESSQGNTGMVNVTVGGPGLTSGSVAIHEVIAGAPQTLHLSAAQPTVAAGGSDPITVQLLDANGDPTTTASAVALTATVSRNGTSVGTLSGTIGAGSGDATLNLTEQQAGTYSVTVQAAGFASQSLNITVTSGAASALQMSPSGPATGAPVDLQQGNASASVSVQLTDAGGNPVAEQGVPVSFSAAGGTGSYSVNGQSGTAVAMTDANGIATATFNFGNSSGTWAVMATSPSLSSASQNFTIVPYVANAVSVTLNQSGDVQAGDTISGTITAEQPNGTVVNNPDYLSVTVSPASGLSGLAFSDPAHGGAALAPVSSTNGTYLVKTTDGQLSFTATAATAGALKISAADASVAGTVNGSASITIIAGSVAKGASAFDANGNNLASSALAVTANNPTPMTVRLTDGYGNPVVSDVPVTVVLADTNASGGAAANGAFRTTSNGADLPNDTLVLPAGSNGMTVYYVNATAGSYLIAANTPGLATAVSSVAGTAGQGSIHLTFGDLGSGGSLNADTTPSAWTVTAGGQVVSPSDYTVAASGNTLTFTLTAGYVSGQTFGIAQTAANTSATGAGVPLSISAGLFGAQHLS